MTLTWEGIGVFVAATITIGLYSFLYKDNPFYKLVEHVYVGVSTGYIIIVAMFEVLKPELWLPLRANPLQYWYLIIPGIMGLMMFTRFTDKYSWLSRFPLAFVIGTTVGWAAPNQIRAKIIKHVGVVIEPIFNMGANGWGFVEWNAIITIVGVVCVLFYFFFSIEQKGVLKPVSYTGIVYLMIYFGASFGYTMMGRISLLIGRINFLIIDGIKPFIAWAKNGFS